MGTFRIHIPFIPNRTDNADEAAAYKITLKRGTKELLDKAMADESEISGASKNAIMATSLYKGVIPTDSEAERYITTLYDSMEFSEPLCIFFDAEASGINWDTRHTGNRPMVEFTRSLLANEGTKLPVKLVDGQSHDICGCWDSVISRLDASASNAPTSIEAGAIREDVDLAKQVGNILERNDYFLLFNAVDIILRHWECLGTYTYSFRFLCHVFDAVSIGPASAAKRVEFKDVCRKVCDSHRREDERRAWEIKRKDEEETRPPSIYLLNGNRRIEVPNTYIVLNHIMPVDKRAAACAIEAVIPPLYSKSIQERISSQSGNPLSDLGYVPGFVLFLDHPVPDMTEEEKEAALDIVESAWPPYKFVREERVALEYGSNGAPLNWKEYENSPRIFFLEIPPATPTSVH